MDYTILVKHLPLQMDTFVNPLRNSMRNVSNAVKSIPDSLAEGMTKMSDNMGKMSERLGQDIKQSFFKVRKYWWLIHTSKLMEESLLTHLN